MLLTPTRRVGVNIGQKSAIATNSSSDWRNYSVGVNNGHKSAIGTNLTLCMPFVILYFFSALFFNEVQESAKQFMDIAR